MKSLRWRGSLAVVVLLQVLPLAGQVCRLSVAGLNRSRRVIGPVDVECPNNPLHSAPFGNWGVTSPFGEKLNGHQFDGWCRDMKVCDNSGRCFDACRDGWYEWNSCTSDALFQAPNCWLYNEGECTRQASTTGINVLGTKHVDLPVTCPRDTGRDGHLDTGGCRDLRSYSHGTNFMTLYELDPLGRDELIQTMYFPLTVAQLDCEVSSCPAAGTEWVAPVAYDSPVLPAKVFAEMAMVVNSGVFLDPGGVCRAVTASLRSVSAASYQEAALAPDSIASSFGVGLARTTEAASVLPLPTALGGVSLALTDSQGRRHAVPLLFVSPAQINWIVPAAAALGSASVALTDSAGTVAVGAIRIERVAPALFSANGNGQGAAAAFAVRATLTGSQSVAPAYQCGVGPGACDTAPIDMGSPVDQVILVLFGTGIRGRSALSEVHATIGGVVSEILYAGTQPEFPGLDQVNIRIPGSLRGRGRVSVALAVEGNAANPLEIEVR